MSRQFCEQRHLGSWCVPASVGQLPLLWPLSSCPRDAPESELGRDAHSCHWVRAGSSPPLVRCLPVEGTLCTGPFHVTSLGLQPSARTAASHAPVHAARSRCRPNVLVTAQAVRQCAALGVGRELSTLMALQPAEKCLRTSARPLTLPSFILKSFSKFADITVHLFNAPDPSINIFVNTL